LISQRAPGTVSKKVIILLSAALLLFPVYCFLLSPQLAQYETLQKRLVQVEARVAKDRSAAAGRNVEKARLAAAEETLHRHGELFVREMRDGTGLIILGLAGSAAGVDLIGVAPGTVREKQGSLEITYNITAKGRYPDILSFCQGIEKEALNDTTTIEYLHITADEKGVVPLESRPAGGSPTFSQKVTAELEIIVHTARNPDKWDYMSRSKLLPSDRQDLFLPPPEQIVDIPTNNIINSATKS
jgi:Tfp pilus assembly protein PilO